MTRANILIRCTLLLSVWAIQPLCAVAQTSAKPVPAEDLPAAPQPQFTQNPVPSVRPAEPQVALVASFPLGAAAQVPSSPDPQAVPSPQAPNGPLHLNRTQAEQLAIKNNPQISVGRLLALAQHQVFRETRAVELPNFNGAITAVDANEGSRIGAGALTASRLLEHAGAGVTLSQLITDFGRTVNLVSSSKLLEKAQNANALATTEDIVLATDQAFYNA
ncbi:MAG: TolC family protein, partial [Candidatus Sulfotelmatobacter sp.]